VPDRISVPKPHFAGMVPFRTMWCASHLEVGEWQ
jgi:hypothetical protein